LPAVIECRRRIVALRPDDPAALGELLVTLHYSPDYSPGQLLEEHREWSRRFERPIVAKAGRHARCAGARDRRLRVGYVSGDFREHPAARFVLPVLRAHDRERVQVVCYSDVGRPLASGAATKADRQTERFREAADLWRESAGWSDERLAEAVRADAIDVLVDLAGHLDSRRLTAFALRPAPVQVGYFGYPGTTGTSCIDYRITDQWHDPPPLAASQIGHAESPIVGGAHPVCDAASGDQRAFPHLLTIASAQGGPADVTGGTSGAFRNETVIRIPGGCWCYDPREDAVEPVTGLPAQSRGYVTFAAFNRLIKVTPSMGRLWAEVLERTPGSRLAVVAPEGEGGDRAAAELLCRYGIDPGRLIVLPRRPRREYLAFFNGVDVALDTFPYAGMTTTCDALWMGVPTVTQAGDRYVARTGTSLLSAAGLPQLIAHSPDEYVDKAVRLANDPERLGSLRSGLGDQVRRSALGNAGRVARALEAAYHSMSK